MISIRYAGLVMTVLALGLRPAGAQSSSPAFGWFAELVSFDAATRMMTAKARIEPHVVKHVGKFAPGDRVVLVWTQFGGEADAIRYVAAESAMAAESGYIVHARFIS